jgi:hypothetical protein
MSEPNAFLAAYRNILYRRHFTPTISVRCPQIIHLDPQLFSPSKGLEILSIPFCSLASGILFCRLDLETGFTELQLSPVAASPFRAFWGPSDRTDSYSFCCSYLVVIYGKTESSVAPYALSRSLRI